MVNFHTWIPDRDSHNPALLDFFLVTLVFVLQWLFLHWEIRIMLLFQFPLTFCQSQNRMPHFVAQHLTILVLIGIVFVISLEIFHGIVSLKSVLLLLLVNCVSEFRSELMYKCLIVKASLISIVFSCLWCCHSSQKSHFSFAPKG